MYRVKIGNLKVQNEAPPIVLNSQLSITGTHVVEMVRFPHPYPYLEHLDQCGRQGASPA